MPEDTLRWFLDVDGYVVSQFGTRVARIQDGTLYLYDKRVKVGLPLTLDDYRRLTGAAVAAGGKVGEITSLQG